MVPEPGNFFRFPADLGLTFLSVNTRVGLYVKNPLSR